MTWRRAGAGFWTFCELGALCSVFAARVLAQAPDVPRGVIRLDSARFTVVAFPADLPLARSLIATAVAQDSFPGLPRPRERVLVAVAPDQRRFREWTGPAAPEWGAAIAFPSERRIVMQGRRASSAAGDPRTVLRHELAHLALREALGDLPQRWFDEGYASFSAGEWGRDEELASNLALVLRGTPTLDALDAGFSGGEMRAQQAYALAYRAVAELAALDPERGLSLFLAYWKETGSFDQAVRRAYGLTESTFEDRWRSSTRRRFGALALVADVSLVAVVFLIFLGPLWVARRRRDNRRLAGLRAVDAAQDARDAASALEALLATSRDSPPPERPAAGGAEGQ